MRCGGRVAFGVAGSGVVCVALVLRHSPAPGFDVQIQF